MQWRDTMTEQAIVAAGSHPVSDWWAGVLDDVLAQDPRRVIVRGGRRVSIRRNTRDTSTYM